MLLEYFAHKQFLIIELILDVKMVLSTRKAVLNMTSKVSCFKASAVNLRMRGLSTSVKVTNLSFDREYN